MIGREYWWYYHWLVVLDLWRLKRGFLLHVVIVAGICLPILILSGLKRGHVAHLREKLEKSATGREIEIFALQRGPLLPRASLEKLTDEVRNIEIVIPHLMRPVTLEVPGNDRPAASQPVTLYPTRSGDPVLRELGGDVLAAKERALVLTRNVAEAAHVDAGDDVQVILRRQRGGITGSDRMKFRVKAIVDTSNTSGRIGYADLDVLEDVERYVQGYALPDWEIGALQGMSAPDKYVGYLVFCQQGDDLRPGDFETLRGDGYEVKRVEDEPLRSLYGLLKPDAHLRIRVYLVTTVKSTRVYQYRLEKSPQDLTDRTLAEDDVAIPWNEPRLLNVNDEPRLVLGVSLPKRIWLRSEFVETQAFELNGTDELTVALLEGMPSGKAASEITAPLKLQVTEGLTLSLALAPRKEAPATPQPAAEDPVGAPANVPPSSVPASGDPKATGAPAPPAPTPPANAPDGNGANSTRPPGGSGEPRPGNSQPPSDAVSPGGPTEERASSHRAKTTDEATTDSQVSAVTTPASAAPATGETPTAAPAPAAPSKSRAPVAAEIPAAKSRPLAVVPVVLLAHIDALQNQRATYDQLTNKFIPIPDEIIYERCRLYADTIDYVPDVNVELKSRGYGVNSQYTRIKEIKDQAASLDLLVDIVTGGVIFFGVATVGIVLWDSTDQKRKTIGIMRIMGVSGLGVSYMVMLRAIIIGVAAAIAASAFGWLFCCFLTWEPQTAWILDRFPWCPAFVADWLGKKWVAQAQFDLWQDRYFLLLTIGCSVSGAFLPAILASRLDPFDAIIKGRGA